ncbi:mediator of RNA polymerase II transcription subunit 25-like protein [Dinothrombium tinctorium]|uniref:Mediator of RNA polymerase II transcription subunit 25 n=1 Tax=Dinothrombium tinctorium TaxID=1965070 RepID=A0A3S4QMC5_9ACAR|nr:mediator of RNA polymerase II transcription subunit 25-like protein [Dinothrombium tinctorium]
MVVNEWPNADVVFVVEATCNLSPYVESIKNNYILPTLEYFSRGPPDDRDTGFDNTYNCSLYAMVVYMSAEVAPGCATECSCPTPSSYKLLQYFDRTQFVGGEASNCSHITEGIATALQCFDDFQIIRESAMGSVAPNVAKHCIFITNSFPYNLPASESVSYNGLMLDQLVGLMAERGINFSIISPRKMSYLFKLFERSGGDLRDALTKNYAKDKRHLILLKGYQLQEKPLSPQPQQNQSVPATDMKPAPSPSTVTQGQKRPLSPSVSSAGNIVTTTTVLPSQGVSGSSQMRMPQAPHPPTFTQPGKAPTPDSIVRPNRGASPVPRMTWTPSSGTSTPPISSASPGPIANNQHLPVLTSQLSMGPIRSATPTLSGQQPTSQPQTTLQHHQQVSLQSQQQSPQQQQQITIQHQQLQQQMHLQQQQQPRAAGTNASQMRPIMIQQQHRGASSPFNAPPPPSQSPLQQSPMSQNTRTSVPSPLSQNVSSPMQPQTQTQQNVGPLGLLEQATAQAVQQQTPQQPQQQQMLMKGRRKIWVGIIEYQEKPVPPHNTNRITYTLQCQISGPVINGEPEVNADKWPEKLSLQLLPRPLIQKLFDILKSASHHVGLHFTNSENEGFQKLSKIMSTNWVGCIQFTSIPAIRMMIVLYMPEKKVYMGFIPHDQEGFFSAMRQMIEQHKKDQQQKHKQMVTGGQQIISNPQGMGQTLVPPQSQVPRPQHPQMVQHALQPPPGPSLQIPVSASNFYQVTNGFGCFWWWFFGI